MGSFKRKRNQYTWVRTTFALEAETKKTKKCSKTYTGNRYLNLKKNEFQYKKIPIWNMIGKTKLRKLITKT